MKKIAILQSNYIPWKGYFDVIASVDEFIIYDCVQYTKNDWRNRNQIKTANGKAWLTVPVRHLSTNQLIEEIEIADKRCFKKHWSSIRQSYARAKHLRFIEEHLEPIFCSDEVPNRLSEMNVRLIRLTSELLGIHTSICDSRSYEIEGDRNQRLISLCTRAGADCYVSGPAARAYLDIQAFKKAGIEVSWMSYGGYRDYEQPHPPFDHHVSVVDLLACTGPDAPKYLLAGTPQ